MSKTEHSISLLRLKALAIEDLQQTTHEDLRRELTDSGLEPAKVAEDIRRSMREAAAAFLRKNAQATKVLEVRALPEFPRPSLKRIQELIAEVFAREPELKVAFREGKAQTDADLMSMYDDLVNLGAIKPDGKD
jgi:hypothetical protein